MRKSRALSSLYVHVCASLCHAIHFKPFFQFLSVAGKGSGGRGLHNPELARVDFFRGRFCDCFSC